MKSLSVNRERHGQTGTPLYIVWCGAKTRCYSPSDSAYSRYGAIGIGMCDQWRDSYMRFAEWAMSHGYESGLILDRIDGKGDYSPDNCRWVNRYQSVWNSGKRPPRGCEQSRSEFKGVCRRGNKWTAEIRAYGKRKYLGMFHSEIEAARAYDCEAIRLFGEFAHLNLPPPVKGRSKSKFDAGETPARRTEATA